MCKGHEPYHRIDTPWENQAYTTLENTETGVRTGPAPYQLEDAEYYFNRLNGQFARMELLSNYITTSNEFRNELKKTLKQAQAFAQMLRNELDKPRAT